MSSFINGGHSRRRRLGLVLAFAVASVVSGAQPTTAATLVSATLDADTSGPPSGGGYYFSYYHTVTGVQGDYGRHQYYRGTPYSLDAWTPWVTKTTNNSSAVWNGWWLSGSPVKACWAKNTSSNTSGCATRYVP